MAGALAAWIVVAAPTVHAASSASYQIPNAALDTAGGASASPSFRLTACVGSEIAGSSSSASYHIDSGCGASALALPSDFPPPVVGPPGAGATPIPTLSGLALALLVVALAALAMRRLRARYPNALG
jgi:hypothetical protein